MSFYLNYITIKCCLIFHYINSISSMTVKFVKGFIEKRRLVVVNVAWYILRGIL